MLKQLSIGDKIIYIGDRCRVTQTGDKWGLGKADSVLDIIAFDYGSSTDHYLIGLLSPIKLAGWSDLSGNVPHGHGLWINITTFMGGLELVSIKHVICNNFIFKNKLLDGIECRILHTFEDDSKFVETESYVNGSSCDGTGKTGHCVIIPQYNLKTVNKTKQINQEENKVNG